MAGFSAILSGVNTRAAGRLEGLSPQFEMEEVFPARAAESRARKVKAWVKKDGENMLMALREFESELLF